METKDIAMLQDSVKGIQDALIGLKTDIAKIQTDSSWSKQKLEETYIELKIMKDGYMKKSDFIDYRNTVVAEHALFATKDELKDVWRDVNWNKKIIWGTILAIIGLAYKVFERYILKI